MGRDGRTPDQLTGSSGTLIPEARNPGVPGPAWRPFELRTIGAGLAFAESLVELGAVLTDSKSTRTAVVQAPPGTGKTTLVPPLVANLLAPTVASGAVATGPAASGLVATMQKILVTQPRRVAARSAAKRLASLDGSRLGGRVGYSVRGERHTSPETVIEFVTPGILLRRLLSDPGLESVGAVVLDEVHERGLETDLLVAMLAEVHQLRDDLTLVAMSATVDASRFAALLGQTLDDGSIVPAPVVDCPKALFPLKVVWAPAPQARLDERGVRRAFLDHVADTAAAAHADALAQDASVDALVFAPGAWEVSHIAARLRRITGARRGSGVATSAPEILELHGQVSPAEQDRAISGRPVAISGSSTVTSGSSIASPPRIIVSTALAESSLTVPGVRLVIDSGLSREPRRDSAREMSGLVTVSSSRASAEQRAGRAARQGPGVVVRCYDEKAFAGAPAYQTPEIAVADLTSAALILACWGAPGGQGLALPDAPPRGAMATATQVLADLGAVENNGQNSGQATEFGKTLSRIPADPRLARALLIGAGVVGPRKAAEAVALVSGDYRAPGADLGKLLNGLRSGGEPGSQRWVQDVSRMEAILRREKTTLTDPNAAQVSAEESLGFVVALAFPGRVARRVGDTTQYLLASGTRAGLPSGSPLFAQEWIAVAEVSRAQGKDAAGTGAVIRAAAGLSAEAAEISARHLQSDCVRAQFSNGKVSARRERALGAIVLSSTPVKATTAQGQSAVAQALSKQGMGLLNWAGAAGSLRRRLAILHRELGQPWPEVSDAALLARVQEWLAPELTAIANGKPVNKVELTDPLRRLLPWPAASRFDELAPERLSVPSGSQVRIDYPEPGEISGRPVVAVKLQECFGWTQTPRIVDGRVPVLFHLLSPAGRPLAVTDDLASFWAGPYAQVRSEMRGRYPKHPWPEDPWSVRATGKVTSKM